MKIFGCAITKQLTIMKILHNQHQTKFAYCLGRHDALHSLSGPEQPVET